MLIKTRFKLKSDNKKIFSPGKYCHPAEGGLYPKRETEGEGGGGWFIGGCNFFFFWFPRRWAYDRRSL